MRIKNRLKTATLIRNNIFETDKIHTAFVCGFILPKIYLPINVAPDSLPYILEHEETHIRRRDYLIKPFAFLALTIHWFNPMMWLSFVHMSKDMEMSCDESVLRKFGGEIKGDYTRSLLTFSEIRSGFPAISPLAFGESNIKTRIKNVMSFKKPTPWIIIFALAIIVLTSITLITNPEDKGSLDVGTGIGDEGLLLKSISQQETYFILKEGVSYYPEIDKLVEENIDIILSSPKESSNPQDYIDAHMDEYENIILSGGEEALNYMLVAFSLSLDRTIVLIDGSWATVTLDNGTSGYISADFYNAPSGLRGYIMMSLCKQLLGTRNNVTDESLSPLEWYSALTYRPEMEPNITP